jgi:hypothetical protein
VLACFDPQWPALLKLQSAAVQQSGLVCGMAIDPTDYYVLGHVVTSPTLSASLSIQLLS